jgi:putative addiction module antidote
MSKPPKPTTPKSKAGVSESPAAFETAPAKPAGRTLKVRRIGNSLGVVLPKEVLTKLGVSEGDLLSVTDTPDGVALRVHDGELQDQLEAARRAMKRYRNALRELAK